MKDEENKSKRSSIRQPDKAIEESMVYLKSVRSSSRHHQRPHKQMLNPLLQGRKADLLSIKNSYQGMVIVKSAELQH